MFSSVDFGEFLDLYHDYYYYVGDDSKRALFDFLAKFDKKDKLVDFLTNYIMSSCDLSELPYDYTIFYNFLFSFLRVFALCDIEYPDSHLVDFFDVYGFYCFIERHGYLPGFHLNYFKDYILFHLDKIGFKKSLEIGDYYG